MLTILAAELGDGVNEEVVTAAAAVELTHLASLYHDDVMDEADLRRGTPTANTAYGNSTAILVGDLLFGHASALVSELGPEAVRIQAETFIRLCTGQIRDDRQAPGGEDPSAYYLRVLEDKTGVLIATAARYGAMFSGCSADVVETMRVYGERLGMAFQLADDLIDIESSEDELGKTPGTDLREGKRTLAVLHALASQATARAAPVGPVRRRRAGRGARAAAQAPGTRAGTRRDGCCRRRGAGGPGRAARERGQAGPSRRGHLGHPARLLTPRTPPDPTAHAAGFPPNEGFLTFGGVSSVREGWVSTPKVVVHRRPLGGWTVHRSRLASGAALFARRTVLA